MPTKGEILKDRYEIQRLLSEEGGMGVVYLATDRTFNNTVVIKHSRYTDEHLRRIYPNLTSAQLRHLADTLRQAFEREARLLRELHHPALPPVIDYFTIGDDQQFFVMNFIPGKNLVELLVECQEKNLGPFPLGDVLNWADQLLDALAYLHAQFDPPIIHRDIKPANLKLKPNGKIVLLDFGLAKGAAGEMSVVGSVLSGAGTPQYAPFEQMKSEGTDARSDLYSLAVTLHHLLTGQPPPYAFTRKMDVDDGKSDPLRPAHEINPLIPVEVSAILRRAASLNPDERPATAAEMREALRRANRTEFIPNPGQPSGQPSEPTTIGPPPTFKPAPRAQSLIDAINEENIGAVVVADSICRGTAWQRCLNDITSSDAVNQKSKYESETSAIKPRRRSSGKRSHTTAANRVSSQPPAIAENRSPALIARILRGEAGCEQTRSHTPCSRSAESVLCVKAMTSSAIAATPSVLPAISSRHVTPCASSTGSVPLSRSPVIAAKPRKKIASGASNCKTSAGLSSPKRSIPPEWRASLKFAVFCRCGSRKIEVPAKLSTPGSKKLSAAFGRNAR
jgi:serine/threonine protein kinase